MFNFQIKDTIDYWAATTLYLFFMWLVIQSNDVIVTFFYGILFTVYYGGLVYNHDVPKKDRGTNHEEHY